MGVDINSLEVKVDSTGLEKLDKAQQDAGKSAEWLEKRQAVLARIQAIEAQQATAAASASQRLAAEQKAAADAAKKLGDAEEHATQKMSAFGTASAMAVLALASIGTAAFAAFKVFQSVGERAAEFQDLAEKMGDSASNVAALSVAANISGTSMQSLVTTSTRLSANIKNVTDESKATGAALKALGLNIEDIKNMNPADRFKAIAEALNKYADSGSKAALMQDLLKRNAAELLPFFKELGEQGELNKILTDEQIKAADDYSDALKRNQANMALYAQAVVGRMMPAANDLLLALGDLIKQFGNVSVETGKMANDKGVETFANSVVDAIGFAMDAVDGLIRSFRLVMQLDWKQVAKLANPITAPGAIWDMATSTPSDKSFEILNAPWMSDMIKKRRAEREAKGPEEAKPQLTYTGTPPKEKKTGGRKGGGEEAAQLAYDLSQIKKSADEEIQIEHNKEQILNAERSARKVDDAQYYAAKRESILKIAEVQEAASVAAIARMKQEALTGKDAINMSRKIAEEESKINQIRQTAATQLTINEIQAADAVDKLAKSLDVARASAQAYLDTIERQNAATLAGIGMGSKYRAELAQINAVEMRMLNERQKLDEQRTRGDLKFGEYEARLAIIEEYGAKEIAIVKKHQAEMDEVRKDGNKGAYEALKNYTDMVADQAKQWEDVTTKAFGGMEDALTEFVTTGKADFKSLADSIIKDIARIMIRQYITGPLSGAMGGGGGGFLGGLFGMLGGGGAGAAGNAAAMANGFGTLDHANYAASIVDSFAEGTDFVPRDMKAQIHQGEAVLTREENRARRSQSSNGSGNMTNVINLHMPQGSPAENKRSAGQGAREAMAAIAGAGRYR